MIVAKAVNMAKKMDIPILGLVENMGIIWNVRTAERRFVFGESHIEETADEYEIPVLAKTDRSVDCVQGGRGAGWYVESPWLDAAADGGEGIKEYRYIEEVEEYK